MSNRNASSARLRAVQPAKPLRQGQEGLAVSFSRKLVRAWARCFGLGRPVRAWQHHKQQKPHPKPIVMKLGTSSREDRLAAVRSMAPGFNLLPARARVGGPSGSNAGRRSGWRRLVELLDGPQRTRWSQASAALRQPGPSERALPAAEDQHGGVPCKLRRARTRRLLVLSARWLRGKCREGGRTQHL